MEETYIPYGPEWEKEMNKLSKKNLIEQFRKSQQKLNAISEKVQQYDPDNGDPGEVINSVYRIATSI